MKKIYWLSLLLILGACASGHQVMTMESFAEIPVGTSEKDIMHSAGKPYAIHEHSDGAIEYEYIERLKISGRNIQERHYYFVIKDGKVASKRVKQISPPGYTFDSYEMQTTQNLPPSE